VREDMVKQTANLGCALCGGCAPGAPAIELDGAISEEEAKGGSVTLASIREGSGIAGGNEDLSMN